MPSMPVTSSCLIFLEAVSVLRNIAPYTTRAEVLSTRSLPFYLAPISQLICPEAREHEIVGHDASFIAKVSDTGASTRIVVIS